jgi:hypothetical protein
VQSDRDNELFAERQLLCSTINDNARSEVVFRVSRPHVTTISEAGSVADGGTCTCEVVIDGLDEPSVNTSEWIPFRRFSWRQTWTH